MTWNKTMNSGIIFYDSSSVFDGENYCLGEIENTNSSRKRIPNHKTA